MRKKYWRYLVIALVAANVIYLVWNWVNKVEQELMGIKQAISRVHPELVRQQQPPPAPAPKKE